MRTSVLIAGAGPTGLMMACQLRLVGVDCIIVDWKSGPTRESRALAVQARSLEIYDQMGITGTAVSDGAVVSGLRFLNPRKTFTIPILNIGMRLTPFSIFLVYEQNKNEELLHDFRKDHGGDCPLATRIDQFSTG